MLQTLPGEACSSDWPPSLSAKNLSNVQSEHSWHSFTPFPPDLSQLTRERSAAPQPPPCVLPQPSLPSSDLIFLWSFALEALKSFLQTKALTELYLFTSVCQKVKSHSVPYGHKESLVSSFFRGANLQKRSVVLICINDSNSTSLTQ